MGATRPASEKYAAIIWQSSYFLPFSIPTRDASPPLEVALGGSVGCCKKALALMGATRLASGKYAAVI